MSSSQTSHAPAHSLTPAAPQAAAAARAPLPLLLVTGAIIFLANAGLLVLQLLAGRYLAPFIGSSVETWTAIIGVFLTGIALGNWIGGRVADRYPSTRTLALLLIVGGLACLMPIGGTMLCEKTGLHSSIPLVVRIPLLAALFCLLPATVVSMITPLVIKLALADVRRAGRVAGVAFALSTLGCLLGNYVTGFWLMAEYRLDTIAIGVNLALVLAGALQIVANRVGREPPLSKVADSPFAPPTARTAEAPGEPAEPGLNLRDHIGRAYAIVFIASFCGMSLELTGSRVLAPILGVSLYSWTGIIGVMLAGTAVGNYLGGVLADRGVGAALSRLAILACPLAGFVFAAPAYESFTGQQPAYVSEAHIWMVRARGVLIGLVIAGLGIAVTRFRWGWWVNATIAGGFVGAVLAVPVVRQFSKFWDPLPQEPLVAVWDWRAGQNFFGIDNDSPVTSWHVLWFELERWSAQAGFRVAPWLFHGGGFLVGWLLTLLVLPRRSPDAPRAPRALVLSTCLLLASLATLAVLVLLGLYEITAFMYGMPLVDRVLAWTFGLFFVPMLLLGTISPQVIRLSVKDVQHAGRTAGTIYAWSTVGAIVGTFVTGYFLIGSVGTLRVLMVVALAIAALAFVVGKLWQSSAMLYTVSIIAGGTTVGFAIKGFDRLRHFDMETKYYAIKVGAETRDDRVVATLSLDRLQHSFVDLKDPTYLGYKHEEVQGELLRMARQRGQAAATPTNLLVIGGGGYTFPRWVETLLPDVDVEVVEIDPGVTEIAYRKLGLPRDTKIRTFNMDGRQYVMERAPKGHYQLVMQDAVNDLSVPFHLMTKEYNDAIKALLTPDGAYLLTFIDDLQNGKLWRAAAHTLRETFSHVSLLAATDTSFESEGRAVYILYGSMKPLPLAEVRAAVEAAHRAQGGEAGTARQWTHVMAEDAFDELLNRRPKLVLTDQYAPVDNLMGGVFLDREPRHR